MPTIIYVHPTGEQQELEIPVGWSVMEGAIKNGLAGIEAQCGGACACATCHVYVDSDWISRLAPKELTEESMLEYAQEPDSTSRLSCQIKVTAELNGLVVRLPTSQR